jgi:hypothetical protein
MAEELVASSTAVFKMQPELVFIGKEKLKGSKYKVFKLSTNHRTALRDKVI